MPLTDTERSRVIELLDRCGTQQKNLILSALENFARWLESNIYSVFAKVKDTIGNFFGGLVSLFL